ncbi:hypothetical protein XarbCFBP7604_09795 [Xanthomonas arboricola]|nr:hypothetical protein XarbCFBP7604_09795 [Xanthomonas arboricola]
MPKIPKGSYEGKAKDRWQPVRRSVIYINLKMSFGSFDRYFYLEQGGDLGDRRATMLNEAKRLKSIKDRNLASFSLGRRQRLFENRDLNAAELRAVGSILGRTYKSARIIIHSLYPGNRGRDMTVIFNRDFEYSEAFAGSGEVAAVSVVVQVLAADPFSLILLDEPETSLHPGAQRALLRFLLQQIKIKKLQVIASTHSADFLEGLPDAAIKVLEDNGDGKTRVINNCSPLVALNRLGRPPAGKMRILVEDPLACMLVEHALGGLDPGEKAAIEVRVAPGGAGAILGHHGPGAMITGDRLFVLLDGDQKKVDEFTDPNTIPPAKYSKLAEMIKDEIGAAPTFLLAGGNDAEGRSRALIESHLNYLGWLRCHVRYLPKLCPEQVLLDSALVKSTSKYNNSDECKAALKEMLGKGVDISGRELQTLFKVAVAQLPLDQVDIAIITSQLKSWLSAENPV